MWMKRTKQHCPFHINVGAELTIEFLMLPKLYRLFFILMFLETDCFDEYVVGRLWYCFENNAYWHVKTFLNNGNFRDQ